MAAIGYEALIEFLDQYTEQPATNALADRWQRFQTQPMVAGINPVLQDIYASATAVVEEELWTSGCQSAGPTPCATCS